MDKLGTPTISPEWKDLCENNDIVIKPADKDSAVVVMSTADYITEGEPQISDVKSYSLLDKDRTQDYLEQVNQAIEALNIDLKVQPSYRSPKHWPKGQRSTYPSTTHLP